MVPSAVCCQSGSLHGRVGVSAWCATRAFSTSGTLRGRYRSHGMIGTVERLLKGEPSTTLVLYAFTVRCSCSRTISVLDSAYAGTIVARSLIALSELRCDPPTS